MDMNEIKQLPEELLVRKFFDDYKEAAPLPDHHFTRRVMRSLPHRNSRIAVWWNVAVSVIALLLLYVSGTFGIMVTFIKGTLKGMIQTGMAEVNPFALLIVFVVLICLCGRKIWTMA
jgi:hypothetical protein